MYFDFLFTRTSGAATIAIAMATRGGGTIKAWEPHERDRFFGALHARGTVAYAVCRLAYETASRITEVLHLTWDQIDFKKARVRIVRLKGSEEVRLGLSATLLDVLRALPRKNTLVCPGFVRCASGTCPGKHVSRQTAWWWVNETRKTAGLELGHPHTLRHTRLVDVARANKDRPVGVQVAALQEYGGHVTVDSLMLYLNDPVEAKKVNEDIRKMTEELP
jgi:integrase